MNAVREFWNTVYGAPLADAFRDDTIAGALRSAIAYFGDVAGKRVLDVGCGPGESALAFAERGAVVTAVDISPVAIRTLNERCRAGAFTNVRGLVDSAFAIAELGPFDLVFGCMILHHLEPFAAFAAALADALEPGGRAYFSENSAANPALLWARSHLAGRAWIPKHGDGREHPLTSQEVDELRKRLRVEVRHPELVMLEMVDSYLLRKRFPAVRRALVGMDRLLWHVPAVRRLSYLQEIYVEKPLADRAR